MNWGLNEALDLWRIPVFVDTVVSPDASHVQKVRVLLQTSLETLFSAVAGSFLRQDPGQHVGLNLENGDGVRES